VHCQRDPLPHEPVLTLGRRDAAGQGILDQVEALVEPIAAILGVLRFVAHRDHRVARPHGVAAAKLDGIEVERASQLVHRGFDREDRLGEPVAADAAGRRKVGVDHIPVDLLVRAPIDR
jgi:hypothetical protein